MNKFLNILVVIALCFGIIPGSLSDNVDQPALDNTGQPVPNSGGQLTSDNTGQSASDNASQPTSNNAGQPGSDNAGQSEIKIGTILGLTGENAAYGIKMRKGLDLALEHANSAPPESPKFRLLVEDSQWKPQVGVNAYRKLHDVDGVRHFVAICGSKIALAVAGASRQDDIVIIDAISGAPKLTLDAGSKYFRVYASDAMAGKHNLSWALEEGAMTFGIVYVEDDWGSSYKDALLETLRTHKMKATVVPVKLGTRDFKTEVEKLLRVQPDALFVVLYANLAVPMVKELRTLGFDGLIYGGDNLSSADFSAGGSEITEGVRLSLPAEPNSQEFKSFASAYEAKYKEAPDSFALKSYDAFMLMVHAIRATDGKPESIIEYLRTIKYSGASGELSFDAQGDLRDQEYSRLVYCTGRLIPYCRSDQG
ncbi:ABC transporter substrate-binding protein [Candidatus Thiosymbion oneisti]|uniref:ABC transporter substrate-binding protein n=1 Tax=Candidatus Thiosymbion oneisti TaxID=589554 RepID=UPI000B7E0EE6|nr:ABC transporter substrate-binding protein [Candidatus Thiosymbion oneisti]